MRELDDAVALGLGARARGERLAWLQAPGGDRRAGRRDPVGAVAARAERSRPGGRLRVCRGAVSRRAPPLGRRARRRRSRGARCRRDGADRRRRAFAPAPGREASTRSCWSRRSSTSEPTTRGTGCRSRSGRRRGPRRCASSDGCSAGWAAARDGAARGTGRSRLVPARRRRRLDTASSRRPGCSSRSRRHTS